MASGTELEVEDIEMPENVAAGSAVAVRDKEHIGASRDSAVWLYFKKMDRVGRGDRMAKCKDCWDYC